MSNKRKINAMKEAELAKWVKKQEKDFSQRKKIDKRTSEYKLYKYAVERLAVKKRKASRSPTRGPQTSLKENRRKKSKKEAKLRDADLELLIKDIHQNKEFFAEFLRAIDTHANIAPGTRGTMVDAANNKGPLIKQWLQVIAQDEEGVEYVEDFQQLVDKLLETGLSELVFIPGGDPKHKVNTFPNMLEFRNIVNHAIPSATLYSEDGDTIRPFDRIVRDDSGLREYFNTPIGIEVAKVLIDNRLDLNKLGEDYNAWWDVNRRRSTKERYDNALERAYGSMEHLGGDTLVHEGSIGKLPERVMSLREYRKRLDNKSQEGLESFIYQMTEFFAAAGEEADVKADEGRGVKSTLEYEVYHYARMILEDKFGIHTEVPEFLATSKPEVSSAVKAAKPKSQGRTLTHKRDAQKCSEGRSGLSKGTKPKKRQSRESKTSSKPSRGM